MTRPLVSVVACSFQRGHLLGRSLVCYALQDFPKDDFELVLVDDGSQDNTRTLVHEFAAETGCRTVYLNPLPKTTEWRDTASIINTGIRVSTGKHVLLTHPECMPGRRSVRACVERLEEFGPDFNAYVSCKPYYLTRRDQSLIDTVDWRGEGPLAVRRIPGFYDRLQHAGGHPDYAPWVIDAVATPGYETCPSGATGRVWDSWVFGGCSRATWKRLGGMIETQAWGAVDIAFLTRRRILGIPNVTFWDEQTIVAHQNHDLESINVPTPRDIDKAHAEAGALALTPEKCVWPFVNNLGD